MDFHILIVISCVFLASLCSLLFINKFFRRKTFEEIIAEKKALNEKIYQSKVAATGPKKPKKLQQQLKKEQKREKKQRQKEQHRDTTEQEDSDGQSEQQSVDDEPKGLSKTHVEFDPDPEVVTYPTEVPVAAATTIASTEKERVAGNQKQQKAKKDKKNAKAAAGILVNKNEPVAVKGTPVVEETLNQFEYKQPKDVLEMKKEKKDEPKQQREQNKKDNKGVKKEKQNVEKNTVVAGDVQTAAVVEVTHVAKEVKQQDEKARYNSPKMQPHAAKTKQQNKKQQKESAATKELALALDKLSDTDAIGVSLLMNLFRRAELNRSEIQILIDYLLNKQQDMPASHSEWSDDICNKLKRQLEEKERALIEEQEASIGIQAKLRELRTEINTERAQLNATVKALYEKIQSKEQELAGLNQEVTALNEKISLERQQFQSKLQLAKQAGAQDLMGQLQMAQNELAHKDKCIADLTCLVNATQQSSEIIQTQGQQIRALEQQLDEVEQESNNRIFELEKLKTVETELAESKVEIRNLQNALESAKIDVSQARKEFDAVTSELALVRTVELSEKQKELQTLQVKNDELSRQIVGFSGQVDAQSKEQSGLQVTLDTLKQQLTDKEHQLAEFNAKNAELLQQLANALQSNGQQHELQQLVDGLQADLAEKHKQAQLAQEQLGSRERELLQQLQEQKEKNNDLRMKNWKLVEALQSAEATPPTTTKHNEKYSSSANASLVQQQQLFAATQKTNNATVTNSAKDEKQLRELIQRLCPEAVKACAGTALSLPFDQWIEQVITTHIKQSLSKTNAANNNSNATSSSNKSTQLNSNSFAHAESNSNHTNTNNNNSTHNSHDDNNDDELLLNSAATTVNSNSRINNNSNNSSSSSSDAPADVQKLNTQNAQLRAKIDELTKLVTKTSNTLSELEGRAREQDEHWRSIVRSKEDIILSLQHSNGKQDI